MRWTPAMPSRVPMTTSTSRLPVAGRGGWGDDVLAWHDRHDRRAGARPGPRVPEHPAGERTAGPDLDLSRARSGHLPRQVGETLREARGTEDLGEGVGLLARQSQHGAGLVGIVARVDDQLELAGALGDDAHPVALVVDELVTQSHAGQQHLVDVHTSHPVGRVGSGSCGRDRRPVARRTRFLRHARHHTRARASRRGPSEGAGSPGLSATRGRAEWPGPRPCRPLARLIARREGGTEGPRPRPPGEGEPSE